ncbi:MAG: NADH-quinone oxidoreductase subunit N [Ignavibacteriaceae bacterium]|nr:NADH-quinone oxidoreductase subunit N [Ignavibacteriaceae bacterium]
MNIEYFFNSLAFIKPEIVISLGVVVILSLDLFLKNGKKLLPYTSILFLLVTLYYLVEQMMVMEPAFKPIDYFPMVAVDSLGTFFKILVVVASVFLVLFTMITKEFDEKFDRFGEYYTLIFGMILGMFFMISATDLILIYLSIEMVSLSSYVLAGFLKPSKRSSEASLKYLIYGAVSSGTMLFGISLLFGLVGSTNLFEINKFFSMMGAPSVIVFFSVLLIFAGIGYKISSVPFHFWTPDVYEGAPTPITAYLSVASKAAGFALLIRFLKLGFIGDIVSDGIWSTLPVFNWQDFLVIISILTMTLGNFAALWQDNVKRMLAYSSIAHAGYLLAALAVQTEAGVLAVMIYFAIYLLMNLGAFLVVIIINNQVNSEHIDDYDGLGYSMPYLGVMLGLFLVSLTGLPPTAGFIGKLYVFLALLDKNMLVLALIVLLNSVISLYYYIRVLKHMFLNKKKEAVEQVPNKIFESSVVFILGAPVLIFGIFFTPLVDFAKTSIHFLFSAF